MKPDGNMRVRPFFWILIVGLGASIFGFLLGMEVSIKGFNSGSTKSGGFIGHPDLVGNPDRFPHPNSVPPGVEALLGRIHKAHERLGKNPDDLEALVILGNASYDIHRYDRAKEYYLAALKLDPNDVHVRTDLASCYRMLGETDRAVQELQSALSIRPTHGTALYNLGMIYLNDLGNSDEAVRVWEKFVSLYPDDPMAGEIQKKVQELKG